MAAQMTASLLGELVLLPAMLCCRPARRFAAIPVESPTTGSESKLIVESEFEPQIHPFPAEVTVTPRRQRSAMQG